MPCPEASVGGSDVRRYNGKKRSMTVQEYVARLQDLNQKQTSSLHLLQTKQMANNDQIEIHPVLLQTKE